MSYNPNIPTASDFQSDSQGQILGNFQRANSSFGTDHYEFADLTTNNGKHKKVTWINQNASIPAAEPTAVVTYANTQSGITMPYYKRDNLPTVFPLAPIKAYCTFALTGSSIPYLAVINDGFNVSQVAINSPLQTPKITFTNPMRTNTYGVLALATGATGSLNGFLTYSIIDQSNVQLSAFIAGNTSRITIIALET